MQDNMNETAAKGLHKLFVGQLLSVIGIVCMLIVTVAAVIATVSTVAGSGAGLLGGLGFMGLFGIAALVLMILGFIFSLMGLSKAGAAHPGFRTALIIVVVGIIVNIIGYFVSKTILGDITTIAISILNFLVVYFVCNSAAELLRSAGDELTAARGDTVRNIFLACTIIQVVCYILSAIPALRTLTTVITAVATLISLVGTFIYMGFLKASSNTLDSAGAAI